MKRLVISIVLSVLSSISNSQDAAFARQAEKSTNMIDAAIAQARRLQQEHTELQNPLNLAPRKTIDISNIAGQYKEVGIKKLGQDYALLVFVSTSMPREALNRIGHDAARVGAVMVLRGLRGQLGTKQALSQTMPYLEGAARAGASIQIDPRLFKKYDVQQVPAYVLAVSEEECGNDYCDTAALKEVGDVSVEFVLEKWTNEPGHTSLIAQGFLSKLRPAR